MRSRCRNPNRRPLFPPEKRRKRRKKNVYRNPVRSIILTPTKMNVLTRVRPLQTPHQNSHGQFSFQVCGTISFLPRFRKRFVWQESVRSRDHHNSPWSVLDSRCAYPFLPPSFSIPNTPSPSPSPSNTSTPTASPHSADPNW